MFENKRPYTYVIWCLVAAGIALRVVHWWAGRPLWLDETYIAENILRRGFLDLLEPLDNSQSAPILFLWGVKASTLLFGTGERAFHLFPLLTAIAQMLLLPGLVRRALPGPGGIAAVFFCAVSVRLLEYAQELKQYGTEAFVVTAIVWLAVRHLEDEGNSLRRLHLWFGGVVGIFLAHTAVFALAAFGVAYLLVKGRSAFSRQSLFFLGMCGVLWLPAFGVNFLIVIAPNYSDPVMKEYWSFAYLRLPFDSEGVVRWRRLTVKFIDYLGFPLRVTLASCLLSVVALVVGFGRRLFLPLFCASLIVLFVAASAVGRAPFYGRLSLFLLPGLVFLFAAGLSEVAALQRRWARPLAWVLVALMGGFYGLRNRDLLLTPMAPSSMKPGLDWVKAHVSEGDTVIVSRWTRPAVMTYFSPEEREKYNVIAGPTHFKISWDNRRFSTPFLRSDVPRILPETDWSRLRKRVWLLVGGDEVEIDQVVRGHLAYLDARPGERHEFERVAVVELVDWKKPRAVSKD